jgi:hypothetical protein
VRRLPALLFTGSPRGARAGGRTRAATATAPYAQKGKRRFNQNTVLQFDCSRRHKFAHMSRQGSEDSLAYRFVNACRLLAMVAIWLSARRPRRRNVIEQCRETLHEASDLAASGG